MVQLFYYENRGKNFKKLLNYEGIPFRVNLYPSEEVGSTLTCYWIVRLPWWSQTRAQIVEVRGARYRYANAKLINTGQGNIIIKGQFKDTDQKNKFRQLQEYLHNAKKESAERGSAKTSSLKSINGSEELKDFQLLLSTNVSNEDFQLGYSMTGTLEQGHAVHSAPVHSSTGPVCSTHSTQFMSVTHFAGVKRKGY